MQKFTVITRKGKFTTNNFKVALRIFQEDFEARKKELMEKIKFAEEVKKLEREINRQQKKNFKKLKEEKRKELVNGRFEIKKLKRITEEWIEATGTKMGARAIVEKAFIDIVYGITSNLDEELLKRGDLRRGAIKIIKRMLKVYDEWEEFYKSL